MEGRALAASCKSWRADTERAGAQRGGAAREASGSPEQRFNCKLPFGRGHWEGMWQSEGRGRAGQQLERHVERERRQLAVMP